MMSGGMGMGMPMGPGSREALEMLREALAVPVEERKLRLEAWRDGMFEAAGEALLKLDEPQAFYGPDGFPYLSLMLPAAHEENFAPVSIPMVAAHALENGLGVTLNRGDKRGGWVFSFGELWAFQMMGEFFPDRMESRIPPGAVQEEPVGKGAQLIPPPETYLPGFARRAIRKFLTERIRLEKPRAGLMLDPASEPSDTLVFSVHPDRFASEEEYGFVMRLLQWYLPPHYVAGSLRSDDELNRSLVAL